MKSKDIEVRGLFYTVYENGDIYGSRGKKLKQRLNEDGYCQVTMGSLEQGRYPERVHRVVANAFIDNPDNLPEVNHIDTNRQNNCVDNLEWTSHIDNVKHSTSLGNYKNKAGILNGRATFSWEDIFDIRQLYSDGMPVYEIARRYNRPHSTILNIVKNNTWKI